jgi:hypothetical protein
MNQQSIGKDRTLKTGSTTKMPLEQGQLVSGFVVEQVRKIPELRSVSVLFTHKKSGARLLHLINDDPNNLFAIAFRTPVSDNTGVPHILDQGSFSGIAQGVAADLSQCTDLSRQDRIPGVQPG